jgi:hypothetical protein
MANATSKWIFEAWAAEECGRVFVVYDDKRRGAIQKFVSAMGKARTARYTMRAAEPKDDIVIREGSDIPTGNVRVRVRE